MNAEALRQHEVWKAARARMSAPVAPAVPVVTTSVCETPANQQSGRRPIAVARRVAIPVDEYPGLIAKAIGRFQAIPLYDPAFNAEAAKRLPARRIMVEVSQETGVPVEEMIGASRRYVIARARQFAMWRIRRECPHMSFPQIGKLFGGRDHTTCLHAFRKMEAIHGGGALHTLYGLARAA